jgi:Ca-activated chloride channel family protein
MELLWPQFLLGLLVLPALVAAYVWRLRRRKPAGVRYSSLSLVRDAVPRFSRIRRHLPFALLVAALAALGIASARPAAIIGVPVNQVTIVLAIDVSGSMCSTDISPTRLQAAEQAASDFIAHQASSTQIGVVAFSGFAEVVQPPTDDQELVLDAIRSLTTGRRTAIGSGLLAAINAIAEIDPSVARVSTDGSPAPSIPPVPKGAYAPDIVVLLTDGVNNAGPLPVDAAKQAADRGVRVYTIGYGTAEGAPLDTQCASQFLGNEPFFGGGPGGGFGGGAGRFRRGIDEDTLKAVATTTGGSYYSAESASELQSVFAKLPTSLIMKHEVVELSVGFVGIGALLAVLALLLAQVWRPLP